MADIDQDGYLEIFVAASATDDYGYYDSYVGIYEHTGQVKENWPIMFPGQCDLQMPIPADINGDNILELGFAMGESTHFVDVNGENLPGWPIAFKTPEGYSVIPNSDIIVVDIDGDGDCEIFSDFNWAYLDSSGYFSYLFAHDHFGQLLPGYPIRVRGAYLFRPPVFAYDSNTHRLYMGLSTEVSTYPPDDTVYVEMYLFPDSTGPPDQWPMLSHDNLMTKNYNFVDNVTAIDDDEKPLPKNYVLMQNYPNPFNSSTLIQFSLPEEEDVKLAVYDILGRKVAEPVNGLLSAGGHKITWDAENYASGIYFYTLQTGKAKISRKMMLLR